MLMRREYAPDRSPTSFSDGGGVGGGCLRRSTASTRCGVPVGSGRSGVALEADQLAPLGRPDSASSAFTPLTRSHTASPSSAMKLTASPGYRIAG